MANKLTNVCMQNSEIEKITDAVINFFVYQTKQWEQCVCDTKNALLSILKTNDIDTIYAHSQ
jgi:hypothetical protein